jgi:2,4-dienoyl-CoA reductase-like NADH-dependent reductase (Old Yellow Enzyme family)/thioredoxin reductase
MDWHDGLTTCPSKGIYNPFINKPKNHRIGGNGMSLDSLFSPISIGALRLENRIVMPPMATNYATREGYATDRQIDYYAARARGGVGYITIEHTGILAQGKASPKMLLINSDTHASHMKKLVDAIHDAGGKVFVQINHAGRQTMPAVTGEPIVGPSPISHLPDPPEEMIPHELTVGEIETLVQAYADAAHRVKAIGADGVEIHMAHGYLICAFLSPFSNKRTDEYGGSIQRRATFAVDVLKSVRKRVGDGFPISCRLSGDEYVDGGIDVAQTRDIAKILESEGADVLHISAANAASIFMNHPPYYLKEGVFVHLAEAVKSVVSIPVIAVGRIRNPRMADQIIHDGKADLISMGRALIADPQLPNKAREGRFEEITPCISCNKCIQTLRKDSVRCAVNPQAGNEALFEMDKAIHPKRVWVVGGGPGGMKAAEIAVLRGHQVTLFEKKNILGGRVRIGSNPPDKSVLNEFVDYLERRIGSLGVTIRRDTVFTAEMLATDTPDAVVIATGAIPKAPDIKGAEECDPLTADDVLSGEKEVAEKVLIVGGGGNGAEIADFLSEKGKTVTLVEMLGDIASDIAPHQQFFIKSRLSEKKVTVLTSCRVIELGRGFAVVEDSSGTRRLSGFGTIVLASGSETGNDNLYRQLEGKVQQRHLIGDAIRPREILDAVFEGQDAAGKI